MKNRKWNNEEDKFLEKNHYKYTIEELAKKIGRTDISIQQRIVHLKNKGRIEKKNHNTFYSKEENRYLLENYRKKFLVSKKGKKQPLLKGYFFLIYG